jgi:proteic killer suppression protein
MIKSFKHKGLEKFYSTGTKAGIIPAHSKRLELLLGYLDIATKPSDLDVAGWGLHPLKGDLEGHWSVKVNGNWRLTFRFDDLDAEVVDYQDYH